ncbi:MAG: FABP family protein [bacterium]|nr:FABP family protein [bacterium]MDE0352686.1 FABP family protein [bacterium]
MSRAHPDLDSLAFLVGTWRGGGNGRYPTIEPFEYLEEAVYTPGPGKPFIAYRQRTRRAGAAGEPLHSESGYIRPGGPDGAELVVAQPTGIVEVHTGEIDGRQVHFRSKDVRLSSTAVEVSRVERRIRVVGDTMRYRVWMAAVGQPLQVHLEAELTRV